MGNQTCPNCNDGKLSKKRKYSKNLVCNNCGYYVGSAYARKGVIRLPQNPLDKVISKAIKKKIPKVKKTSKILKKHSHLTDVQKSERNDGIRKMRRDASIRKYLKKLADNKYSKLRGKILEIDGELWDVEKQERLPEVEFTAPKLFS